MCRIDGEGEVEIGSLVELQPTTEMEEESSEKIGSPSDNKLKPSEESLETKDNMELAENLTSNIFSPVQFPSSLMSLGHNWDGIAVFEAPDDNDLNSNKGLLMAKHFVLMNEMLWDDYQYLSPSILDSEKHEEPADWDKDSPMEVENEKRTSRNEAGKMFDESFYAHVDKEGSESNGGIVVDTTVGTVNFSEPRKYFPPVVASEEEEISEKDVDQTLSKCLQRARQIPQEVFIPECDVENVGSVFSYRLDENKEGQFCVNRTLSKVRGRFSSAIDQTMREELIGSEQLKIITHRSFKNNVTSWFETIKLVPDKLVCDSVASQKEDVTEDSSSSEITLLPPLGGSSFMNIYFKIPVIENFIIYAIRFWIHNPNLGIFCEELMKQIIMNYVNKVNAWFESYFGSCICELFVTGQRIKANGFSPDVSIYNVVIGKCIKSAKEGDVQFVLKEVPEKFIVRWNVIAGYALYACSNSNLLRIVSSFKNVRKNRMMYLVDLAASLDLRLGPEVDICGYKVVLFWLVSLNGLKLILSQWNKDFGFGSSKHVDQFPFLSIIHQKWLRQYCIIDEQLLPTRLNHLPYNSSRATSEFSVIYFRCYRQLFQMAYQWLQGYYTSFAKRCKKKLELERM
ncbi:hypothetical protein A4A49_21908 [Nicotiana attenuata]|uniref:Uncharacterized protein n=1 Tax=Nicotiana attenuata TaxID=49451 RepID=A0A1J6KG86_NICAT|nr:hypothetical protein A4A49_21908 [Nicotiana attenuata]